MSNALGPSGASGWEAMSETATRLTTALADRYRIERKLGQGGMATVDPATVADRATYQHPALPSVGFRRVYPGRAARGPTKSEAR